MEAQREVEYKGLCEEREVRCREERGYMRWKRKRKDWTEEEKDEKGNGWRRKRKKEGAVRDERRKTKEIQEGLWWECLRMKERWLKRWKPLPVLSCMCSLLQWWSEKLTSGTSTDPQLSASIKALPARRYWGSYSHGRRQNVAVRRASLMKT